MNKVKVTYHAIEQFPLRVFNKANLNKQQIEDFLTKAALKGHYCCKRPGAAWEVQYNGVSIVVVIKNGIRTVVTCLGDSKYRKWCKTKVILPRYSHRSA